MIRLFLPLAVLLTWAGWAQERRHAEASQADAVSIVKRLSQKCLDAKEYAIEGEIGLSFRDAARKTRSAKTKFALAISGPDRYALKLYEPARSKQRMEPPRDMTLPEAGRSQGASPESWVRARVREDAFEASLSAYRDRQDYWRISDAQNLWSYVPKQKQYAVRAADHPNSDFESRWAVADYPEPGERLGLYVIMGLESFADRRRSWENDNDPVECILRLIIPTLGRLYLNAAAIDAQGPQDVKLAGQSHRWQQVRLLSNTRLFSWESAQRIQSLVELTLDPDALTVGRMVWTNVYDPALVQVIAIDFTRFSVGEDLGQGAFTFVPPAEAKRVGCLALPGQTGSAMVGCPAPQFLAKDLSGKELRFSTLRGNAVLLAFIGWPGLSGTGCPDCLTLPATLQKLHQEYGKQGLIVLGVLRSQEYRQAAAEAGLTFPLFDGSTQYHNLPKDVIGPYIDSWQPPSFFVASPAPSYSIPALFRVSSAPSAYLIDKDGIVVGFQRELSEESLRAMLGKVGFY